MIQTFKEKSVMLAKAKKMTDEELKGKYVIGNLHNDEIKTEFCDEYQQLIDSQQTK